LTVAIASMFREKAVGANDSWLWDLRSRQIIGAPLPGPEDQLAFTPSGELVGTSDTGQAVFWKVTEAAWEAQACSVAGRNLNRSEWSRYLPDRPYTSICP
jgi:hypothetical protein